jgi:hypothetical protein
VRLLKKAALGFAIATAIIFVFWLPLALGLMAGFPFALWTDDDEVEPVGARATFEESADCLFQYRHYSADRDLGARLDTKKVAVCFPPQSPVRQKALIACFNRYERNHPGHAGWPEDNMLGCRWDGLIAVPTPFAFGKVVAEPPVPRAGRRCIVKVVVTGSDSAAEEVNSAIRTGALAVAVTVGGLDGGTPLDFELKLGSDNKIHVSFMVPATAEGKLLTIKLTIAPDTPRGTKIAEFIVG